MTEFQRDYKYVIDKSNKIYTPDQLNEWKRLRRWFEDKYIILVSQTDKTFIEMREQLLQIEQKKTLEISSAYLFK